MLAATFCLACFTKHISWQGHSGLVAFSTVEKVLALEVGLGDSHLFACSLKNIQKRISELSESIGGILSQGAHAPGELASSTLAMGVLKYFVSRFPRGGHLHEKLELALNG